MEALSAAPLLPLALAWLLGLWLAGALPLGWPGWLSIAGIMGLAMAAAQRQRPRLAPWPLLGGQRPAVALTLLGLVAALAGARTVLAQPDHTAGTLAALNDKAAPVVVTGVVATAPDIDGSTARLRVAAQTITAEGAPPQAVRGMLVVTVSRYPAWHYGDVVRLRGLLETPPNFEGFAYRDYLARQGILSIMRRVQAERVAVGQGAFLFQALATVRDRARLTIEAMLPDPHAGLLAGILLGLDGGIAPEVLERFSVTGSTHVLVISGANFAVVAGVVTALAARLAGRRRSLPFSLLAIAGYAALVGGEPAVVRAALMGSVYALGRATGRPAVALNSLAFAILVMTAWNPLVTSDLGFQLSVLATLGLIAFVPLLSRRLLPWMGESSGASAGWRGAATGLLSEGLVVTLAAQMTTTPLIVATFERLSLVSVLTNLLIVPVQGWLMVSGGLATLAGMLWLPLGTLLAAIPWLALQWTVQVVTWTAALPWASITIPGFNGGWLVAAYLLLALVWLRATGRLPTRAWWREWWEARTSMEGTSAPAQMMEVDTEGGRLSAPAPRVAQALTQRLGSPALLACVALLALLPWAAWWYQPDGRLHLYLLDVGQGDGLLVVTPRGQRLVIDGGPTPQTMLAQLGSHLPPWSRQLEMVVLTHPDADHLGGLPEVLGRYEVETVLHPGTENQSALFDEWSQRLAAEGATVVQARRGQRIEVEPGVVLEVLHPGPALVGPGINNDAVVLRLRYGHFCALLTGDIETEAEQTLLKDDLLSPCPVLKVAHHGSESSSTAGFLAEVKPRLALVSVGDENRYGHPAPDVVARFAAEGIPLLRTDERGTIEIISDGHGAWVRTEE